VAVANGRAIRVVAALGADGLGDLGLHQLGQDAQADAHRQGQKALLGSSDELPERLLDALGQYVLMLRAGLVGRYLVIHGGPPCDLGDRSERCQRQRTKREDRRLQVLRATGQTPGDPPTHVPIA
jgi:hypothetical protein